VSSVTGAYVEAGGYDKGTISFTATTPGTYFATYKLESSPSDVAIAYSEDFVVSALQYSVTPALPGHVQEPLIISWTAPSSHPLLDTIALYELNSDGTLTKILDSYVQQGGYDSGSVTFLIKFPGTYIVKYVLNSNSEQVASSNYFNITVSGYSVTVPSSVYIYTSFTASWTAPAQHSTLDAINIYFVNLPNSLELVFTQSVNSAGYDRGSISFQVTKPGQYVAKYKISGYSVVDTANFNALALNYAVTAPNSAIAKKPFSVTWYAPTAHKPQDMVVLAFFQTDLQVFSTLKYESVSGTGYGSGTVQFSVNDAGSYICYYQLSVNQQVVNISNIFPVTASLVIV